MMVYTEVTKKKAESNRNQTIIESGAAVQQRPPHTEQKI